MILIKNGRLIDPKTRVDANLDILIKDGKIYRIGSFDEGDCSEVIDAKGCVVAPGLIDVHVHFRDPGYTYKEDLETGANSAARGGFTTVVCMANTKPIVDNEETLKYILDKSKELPINVLQSASITKSFSGRHIVDMEKLKALGAVGFTDDGLPLMDSKVVMDAMFKAKDLKVPLSFHEEDPSLIENTGINRGKAGEKLGIIGAPRVAEDVMVARDCMLALYTGAKVNIQHISSGVAVESVRMAKKLGADVVAEATPHHFTLTEDSVLKYGTYAKMNPPLRTEEDRLGIIEGLKDGTIEVIATDHAPHTKEEKSGDFIDSPSGIIGLETSLGLGITSLVDEGHLTLMELLEKMTINPAKIYGLNVGSIEEGKNADIVIFDIDKEWKVEDFASKACNTPFLGWTLKGRVEYTICNGEVVYKHN
ncbi:dihydroorotase [Metaclostridioides mangenotii]|uniref:dihydroorotase n=1 Tax=Metaclostridioides mangenotii TaxID=1540 RepID=UPI000463E1F3|nr:dihydroorotase [Clostridioides mangenotii]